MDYQGYMRCKHCGSIGFDCLLNGEIVCKSCKRNPFKMENEMAHDTESTQNDPWKHRSKGMCCATCMWFVLKVANVPTPAEQKKLGRCRRHAPTMNGYPAVFENDWCGDHKLDENKV